MCRTSSKLICSIKCSFEVSDNSYFVVEFRASVFDSSNVSIFSASSDHDIEECPSEKIASNSIISTNFDNQAKTSAVHIVQCIINNGFVPKCWGPFVLIFPDPTVGYKQIVIFTCFNKPVTGIVCLEIYAGPFDLYTIFFKNCNFIEKKKKKKKRASFGVEIGNI